jgi:hypothetical protein
LNAFGEVSVLLIAAQIFKGQDGDRFVDRGIHSCITSCLFVRLPKHPHAAGQDEYDRRYQQHARHARFFRADSDFGRCMDFRGIGRVSKAIPVKAKEVKF